MRCLLFCVLVAGVGCGDDLKPALRPDGRPRIDAARYRDAEDMDGEGIPDAPNIDAPPAVLSCAYYCNTIQTACTGTNEQYESNLNCLSTCAQLPAGSLGMTLMDTLGCRISHAMNAFGDASMAAAECPKAGPAGDITCGTTCEAFCDIENTLCPGEGWSTTPATCLSQCAATGTIAPATYNTSYQTGNTSECRLYWATVGTCSATKRTGNSVCK
jgi:hypothetical protein